VSGRPRLLGLALAGLIVLIWSGFIVSSRFAATTDFTPSDLVALRFAVAGLIMLPVALFAGRRLLAGLAPARMAALVATAGFGWSLAAYGGFAFAPAADGAILMPGTLPVFAALFAWLLLGEPWTPARRLSLALVTAGAVLVGLATLDGQRDGDVHAGAWRGHLLFLLAAASWGLYTVLARRWRVHPVAATAVVAVGTAALYLPVYWVALPSTLATAPLGAIVFQGLYQGLLAVVVAQIVYTRAVELLGPAETTTVTALVPGTAALLAVPVLGEALEWATLAGLAAVTIGIVVGVRGASARARAAAVSAPPGAPRAG